MNVASVQVCQDEECLQKTGFSQEPTTTTEWEAEKVGVCLLLVWVYECDCDCDCVSSVLVCSRTKWDKHIRGEEVKRKRLELLACFDCITGSLSQLKSRDSFPLHRLLVTCDTRGHAGNFFLSFLGFFYITWLHLLSLFLSSRMDESVL